MIKRILATSLVLTILLGSICFYGMYAADDNDDEGGLSMGIGDQFELGSESRFMKKQPAGEFFKKSLQQEKSVVDQQDPLIKEGSNQKLKLIKYVQYVKDRIYNYFYSYFGKYARDRIKEELLKKYQQVEKIAKELPLPQAPKIDPFSGQEIESEYAVLPSTSTTPPIKELEETPGLLGSLKKVAERKAREVQDNIVKEYAIGMIKAKVDELAKKLPQSSSESDSFSGARIERIKDSIDSESVVDLDEINKERATKTANFFRRWLAPKAAQPAYKVPRYNMKRRKPCQFNVVPNVQLEKSEQVTQPIEQSALDKSEQSYQRIGRFGSSSE